MFSKLSASVTESIRPLTANSSLQATDQFEQPLTDRVSNQFQSMGRASSRGFVANNLPDQAGDTLATARNITVGINPTAFTDFVGAGDDNDYYRFTLTRRATFNLSLTGLTGDADVQLLSQVGAVINRSDRVGTADESLNMTLDAGTYYLRVYPFEGNTNYTMRVARTSAGPTFAPNSLLATEVNVGVLTNLPTASSGVINSSNTMDTYRFNLTVPGSLNATLTGLTGDIAFRVIRDANNNGLVDSGEEVMRSQRPGTSDEAINLSSLAAGNYFLQVYQFMDGGSYDLKLATNPAAASTSPSDILAGEINAGILSGTQVHTNALGASNTSDIYRFSLSTTSNMNASLNVANGDINMRLIRDVNGNGMVDAGDELVRSQRPGTQDDAINASGLAAGNYFLQVYQQSGSGSYTLHLSNGLAGSPSNLLPVEQTVTLGTMPTAITGAIGNLNTIDTYRFNINQVSTFNANLGGLAADINIRLVRDFNNNGVVDPGEELVRSQLTGNTAETLTRELGPGSYIVQVYQGLGSSNYSLQMNSTPVVNPFNSTYGYGLVDAAAAFALARGMVGLPAVPDLGGVDWTLDMINAPEVWAQGQTGRNVVVAVIDSGVDYNHVDLRTNIWTNSREIAGNGIDDDGNGYIDDVRGWDFVNNDNDPMDLDSHGTHVAGTIAAERNEIGMTGVAPNAQIMAIRVLDETGYGEDPGIARGIRYAVNNGASVINLSLGGDAFSQEIADALSYAANRNVVVVMASGNEGASSPAYPAWSALTNGIAVGAVDHLNQVAAFSNNAGNTRMNYLVAPGVGVYSTTPSNTYSTYQGTSMAAPQVAGVAALLRGAFPTLTAAQVENILMASANPNGIRISA